MKDQFHVFADVVQSSFQKIADGEAFVVNVGGDDLYLAYLAAFPDGTNPIFRKRTEHDCSCCKGFIRHVGNVVGADGSTIWDKAASESPHPYNAVARALADKVRSSPIVGVFRVKESGFGAKKTRSETKEHGVEIWHHFYTGEIPQHLHAASPGQARGDYETTVQVFRRGLEELRPDALDTVLSLIDSNNLYRGEEHRAAVADFRSAQMRYQEAANKNLFVWTQVKGSAARLRNSAIGTLVQDLSDGTPVDAAVRKFEAMVAPANYKRPKAIVTPAMIKEAMKTIAELDLEPALERRFARIDDISINDVLWADGSAQQAMKGGIGAMLLAHAQETAGHNGDEKKAKDIGIDEFMADVLPYAKTLDVLLKGEHLGNLMSLTAPVHDEPKHLFRWANDFAWSYAGNIADSIKERVKKAGGKVTGVKLRASLSWYNTDDLDLHCYTPRSHIYFGSKRGTCGGELDVDMNVTTPVRDAVENTVWARPPDGNYRVTVHNFTHREAKDIGFVVEIENEGKIQQFSYPKEVKPKEEVLVAEMSVKGGVATIVTIGPGITTNAISQEKWGLKTENYVRVNAVTYSPNYWHGQAVGNRHTFFLLSGAKNDEPTRGIYNEFLHPRLEAHRKVFELIGDKTKCQPTEGQLSGLGFSSTKPDAVVVRVDNQRLYRVRFGAQ